MVNKDYELEKIKVDMEEIFKLTVEDNTEEITFDKVLQVFSDYEEVEKKQQSSKTNNKMKKDETIITDDKPMTTVEVFESLLSIYNGKLFPDTVKKTKFPYSDFEGVFLE